MRCDSKLLTLSDESVSTQDYSPFESNIGKVGTISVSFFRGKPVTKKHHRKAFDDQIGYEFCSMSHLREDQLKGRAVSHDTV